MARVAKSKHSKPTKGVIPKQFVAQINKMKRKAGHKPIKAGSTSGTTTKRGKKHDHRVAGGVRGAITRKLRAGAMFV